LKKNQQKHLLTVPVVMLLTGTIPAKGQAATAEKSVQELDEARLPGKAARGWDRTYRGPASGPLCGRKEKDP